MHSHKGSSQIYDELCQTQTLWARVSIYLANHNCSISQTINQFWSGFRGFPYFFFKIQYREVVMRSLWFAQSLCAIGYSPLHPWEWNSVPTSVATIDFVSRRAREKKTHPLQERRFKQRLCFQTGCELCECWVFLACLFKLDITWLTRSHWLVDHWQKMTSSACSKFLQRAQKGLKFSSALWLNSSTTTQKHFTRIDLGWSHWGATRRWHSRPHLASQKPWRSDLIFGELRIPSDWLVLI